MELQFVASMVAMYDLNELESQWNLYNLRRRKKHLLIGMLLIGLFFIIALIFYILVAQEQNKDTKLGVATSNQISSPMQADTIETNKTKNIITLSLPVIAYTTLQDTQSNEIDLSMDANITAIDILLKRYEAKKDYHNTIELAKAYLLDKQYANARKYAIKANELDSSKEDGWIVFAKASAALGATNEAIKALEYHNQISGSVNTKNLEMELKNNR